MIYIIAEKPSLARAIAGELPGEKTKGDNCIIAGKYKVGWLAGHVLEMLKPEEYKEEYKSWEIGHLPIVPEQWKLKPIVSSKGLLNSVKKHLKSATEVVNAGDPDREGQLLIDEVLLYLGWRGSVKRLLVNDPSPKGVQKAVSEMRDNKQFLPLYKSGLARQRADWLYGLNMTRLYTILGQKGGYDGVLSIGRVQTPVLGLVVRRQKEIDNFKAKNFYEVFTKIKGVDFKWKPSCENSYFDEENRLIDKGFALSVRDKINGKGTIKNIEKKEKKDYPPLTFSLAGLQVQSNHEYGYSAQQVLDICQSLYEKHKLLTYPRSDCQYLPEKHYGDRTAIINAICSNIGEYKMWDIDPEQKSKAFNDKKITAHHALIPTGTHADMSVLSEQEQIIYRLVSERYLSQFLAPHKYFQTIITVVREQFILVANGRTTIQTGWREHFKGSAPKDQSLPEFEENEEVEAAGAYLMEKFTTPPLPFTEGTLLKAMQNIGTHVKNLQLKKILKETDGIGTPATQSQIIETLFKRNYIVKKKKNIAPTEIGSEMIGILPLEATTPDMTAYWESYMKEIEAGNGSLENFMLKIEKQISQLVQHGKNLGELKFKNSNQHLVCPKCGKGRIRKGKFAYTCSDYKVCNFQVSLQIAGKKVTPSLLESLLTKKKTPAIKGFKAKSGNSFSAHLVLTEDFKVEFEFAKTKGKRKKKA